MDEGERCGNRDWLDKGANYVVKGEPADDINHPAHYTAGGIEVIDVIEALFPDDPHGYHKGNIVKYLARARHKGTELKDLQKAKWYLERIIQKIGEAQ